MGEILCKELTWSNDSREDNQHSGCRNRKKGILGEVCSECCFPPHVGMGMPGHISTHPASGKRCWLPNKTFSFGSSFYHLVKERKERKQRTYPNLGKVQGKSSMLHIQAFWEDNRMIYLKNLKMTHFL